MSTPDMFPSVSRQLTVQFERSGADADARTVPMTISTDAPITGPLGLRERLPHTVEAVDLSRARGGLPLRIEHERNLPIGRVGELRITDGRLRGVARFSKSVRAGEVWADVLDGIITDVSIGAHIEPDDWEEDGDTLVARRWTPLEASLVSIGADPGAGINRGSIMQDPNAAASGGKAAPSGTAPIVNRSEEIAAIFTGLDSPEWVTLERDALRSTDELDVIRGRVMDRLKTQAAEGPSGIVTSVRAGTDGMEKWCEAAESALLYRFGLVPEADRAAAANALRMNELAGMSLREVARDYLRARGESVRGLTPDQLVKRALMIPSLVRTISHSTSDFANILGSSAEKALSTGYMEAPETYSAWTRNVTMTNFRQHSFTNLSLFGDLAKVNEDGEFTHGTFSDRVNTATLSTYGKLFSITRQAIINDDLQAFVDVPRRMGRAAARQVGDLVYAVLTDDTKLTEQAGATLFNTTDGNLAASGAVISTTTLDLAATAMGTMTDPSGATLNIIPRYLLVPRAISTAAKVQIASEKDPAEGSTTSFDAPNPFRDSMTVITEPRLDSDSATAYYVLAGPGEEVDTVVVGWLNGVQTPTLELVDGFSIDGITHKVRIDCTAAALDWRGMYQNAGA